MSSGKVPQKAGKVVLTFDDAMSCHYEYVFPELRKRGLWGIFYVPTCPYVRSKMLDVHRIHLLCGAFDGHLLLREARSLVSEDMVPDSKRREFRENTYVMQDNFEGVSEFKRLLNYFISYEFRESVIDEIGKRFSFNFDYSNFYVKEGQLRKMRCEGMVIGSHTMNHPVMSKLSKEKQKYEIESSFEVLRQMAVIDGKTYCHPYGGFHSFNSDTLSLLEEQSVLYSFNVEPREIEPGDFVQSKHSLPRFDCNLFQHGKAC